MNADTVSLHLENPYTATSTFIDSTAQYFNNVSEHSGETSYTVKGKIGKATASVNANRLKLDFSLPEVIKGDNQYSITLDEVRDYITCLSDTLDLPIDKAEVKRYDFCHDIALETHPESYLTTFSEMPRYRPIKHDNGLTYSLKSNKKQFSAYNKVIQKKNKRVALVEANKNKNILRLENRFMKDVKNLIKRYKMNAEILYNAEFYNFMVKDWQRQYTSIIKYQKMTLPQIENTQGKNLEAGFAYMVHTIGLENYLNMINREFKSGNISRAEKKRTRDKAIKVINKYKAIHSSELIEELDRKVHQYAINHLL